jgi:hypothetical protein
MGLCRALRAAWLSDKRLDDIQYFLYKYGNPIPSGSNFLLINLPIFQGISQKISPEEKF